MLSGHSRKHLAHRFIFQPEAPWAAGRLTLPTARQHRLPRAFAAVRLAIPEGRPVALGAPTRFDPPVVARPPVLALTGRTLMHAAKRVFFQLLSRDH